MDIKFDKSVSFPKKNELISDAGVSLLQYRVQQEDLSSRIYLAMSMWLENNGYLGAAKLWKKYSDEERSHADFAREYLLSMGITPETAQLDKQPVAYSGLPEIVKLSYDHEIDVTKQCKKLASNCLKEGDHMLYSLGLKYLQEQIEEHDKMQNIADRLTAFGTEKLALRLLDEELGDLA